jgi:uncharacterized protein (TIGR03435 family)
MRGLLQLAYPEIVDDARISGVPPSLDKLYFDIDTTFDPMRLAEASAAQISPAGIPRGVSEMMQSLLTSRFQLKAHFEHRELPILALILARSDGKLGRNLRRSEADCLGVSAERPKCGTRLMPDGKVVAIGGTLDELVGVLEMRRENPDRPIRNHTGLEGRFDFSFQFNSTRAWEVDAISSLVSELGLKLEPRRQREPLLVVDHVERASPN